jgi:predicted TIM-barrel fold metal-dependent hydrolase
LAAIWTAEFDRHEVSGALMIASVPGDEESVAAAVAAFPDRIAGAFMFDPTKPDAETRARRAFDDLRLRVICLFPAMHHYSVAENEEVRAVVAAASERSGTAVFVHCGALSVGVRKKLGLPSHFDMRRSNPLEIYRLAAEFPKTNFIVPHFGAGMFRETMMLADLCPNVYVDTSSTNKWMKYEAAPVDLPLVFKRALDVVGSERLLFGTDSSFFPRGWVSGVFDAQINALSAIGASEEQAQAIFGGNVRRLLNLSA